MTDIVVPTLGESVSEATVAKWLKKEGDTVKTDEPIVELETDKVTLEVNAPADGVIASIAAKEGETVAKGAVLGSIEAGAGAGPKVTPAPKDDVPASAQKMVAQNTSADLKNGPAATKMMADNHLSADDVKGSGRDGRVTKGDVAAHLDAGHVPPTQAASTHPVSGGDKPAASAPRDAGPREEKVRMSKLRQVIAKRLKEAQNTAAILTTFNEIDMTAVMEMRGQYKDVFEKKHGAKLGFMSFFVKATIQALKEFPAVNAEIAGDEVIYKNYYDLGIAVSTPQGLVVPVVKDCDSKSMAQIEKDIGDVGLRARDGKLSIDEMQGGTFTITNGGIFGSLLSTPILNTPQVGILGMHKIQQRPMVMPNGEIKARPMMYIALSYDHRIIDGKEAVSFLVRIKESLEDPSRLVLEI